MSKLTDSISAAIETNNARDVVIPIGKGPNEVPARTYISPTDSYDDEIGFDNPTVGHAPGAMRGMFVVNEQQQASIPVTQITKSGVTNSNAVAAIQGGIATNARAPASVWAAVPQMLVNLAVQGPVMLQANVSVHSTAVSDTVGFAVYRDGKLLGNHVTYTTPATASVSSLVQLSAMDNPPSGNHLYALYWSPGTGTLVATSNQRNLYAINLSPQ